MVVVVIEIGINGFFMLRDRGEGKVRKVNEREREIEETLYEVFSLRRSIDLSSSSITK